MCSCTHTVTEGLSFSLSYLPYKAPDDFKALVDHEVMISAGTTETCTSINITEDAIVKGDETFTVTLTPKNDADVIIGSVSFATITIQDTTGVWV